MKFPKLIQKVVAKNSRYFSWGILVVMLLIIQTIAYNIYTIEKEKDFLLVQKEATYIKNQLENTLNHSSTATKMLAFMVQHNLLENYFDSISNELMAQNKFIDALQLVKGTTIVKTFPLVGNEATIGYSLAKDISHKNEALKALSRNELYFEGPILLQQGGKGVVGRLPIVINNKFWGFAAVVIRNETLIRALGIDSTGIKEPFIYQLTKYDDKESGFFSNNVIDTANDIYSKASVTMGDWNIYVKLNKSFYQNKTVPFAILGIVFSVVLVFFVQYITAQPNKLQLKVEEKTKNLDELNIALNIKAKELQHSNKELEHFAFVASHDLQEPLRMITSFLERLEQKYKNQLDEKAQQYIFYAVDGAKRMRQIILDLLQYSRASRTDYEKESIDLNEIVREYILLRKTIIEEKSAVILSEKLPILINFKSPITQVFHNLLDNALTYSQKGTPPEIQIGVTAKEDYWEFSIKDNGIGIEAEYFEKIFVIFHRLHTKDEVEGTGLGLAIAKKVVNYLGGEIWVKSELAKGSSFYFTIKA